MENLRVENSSRKPWLERIITLALVAYFIFGYLPIAGWNDQRGIFHTLALPGEEQIPFIVHFIWGYSLVYGSVLLIYWAIPSWAVFKKMAWGFFGVTTIHYFFFWLYPVRMIWRPSIVEVSTISEWMARLIFSVDNTYNCFPSLHVAYPTLATILSWRFVPRVRLLFAAMAFVTALSVVLVKQHYILDAVGGMAVAFLVGLFIVRRGKFNKIV